MRKAVLCTVLALAVPWVSACGTVSRFKLPPERGEAGCTVAISNLTHNAIYETVSIVGEHPNRDDWWIVFVNRDGSDYVDVAGVQRAVNYPKSRILRMGEVRVIQSVLCRCPQ